MAALLIGYARCSTDQQDLTAQHDGLTALGVSPARIYVDHGLTGTTRHRPGLREAMAACREGDTLVVTKLDRLARSLPDARAIADELTARQVRLRLGASVYDPKRPGRPAAVQRVGHGRGVRVRPGPAAHPRRDEGSEGQGSAPRQAAQAQPPAGSASGRPAPGRGAQHRRTHRPVRCRSLHHLPRPATPPGSRPTARPQMPSREKHQCRTPTVQRPQHRRTVRRSFQKRTGESRRRASYSTTMSLPDTDTVPRPRGQTFVSILNVVPSPGIFAKICWGPRTICPFSTS